MKINLLRERLLASSMICGAAVAALAATPALAQQAEVQEIVVTGSRIPTPNLTSVSPVVAITAADIKAQGVTRVEDMINSLPQAFAAQGASISNGSNGTATVNLRGLGASRTLVLIDGRRVGPGNPSSATSPAVDLNFIPSALVERVDVLTGGASAVYGADAVAGVVNFIMKKDFEGVKIDAQWSTYQHSQHNDSIAAIVAAKAASSSQPGQFALPKDDVTDGQGEDITLTIGMNSADGKGNVTAYASYRKIEAILQGNRDFSACTLNSGATFSCGGSGTAYPARVGSYMVDGSTFRARTSNDVYNYGPSNYYQRPDERYSLGAFAHYQINDKVEAYGQLMFMDDRSVAQIAPGGIFAGTFTINCDNAFMTAAQQTQLCGANAGSSTATWTGTVARRNIEGGGRQSEFRHQSYRYVTGVRGDLAPNWNYDAYLEYSSTTYNSAQTGYFQTSRIKNALIARKNSSGQIVCQSVIDGSDSSCVPYNIFQEGQVTAAMLGYLEVPSYSTANSTERVASASLGGDLTPYGIKTPWAKDGLGVALGTEYREEHLDYKSDFVATAGLLNGAGGASPAIDAGFEVYELYGEVRVPLVQDKPFIKDLKAELGYRFSDYSYGVSTNAYKAGGDWTPFDGLRLRAGYQRSVRAPNLVELYGPQNVVLDGTTDPCAGLSASSSLVATCAKAFNLTTAQVLAIEKNPASQYNGLTGGNPDLQPETSDTYTLGFVATPNQIPGLNVSVDWFDIKVADYISNIGANTILSNCLSTLSSYYCSLVHRDSSGSLFLSSGGYVTDTTLNTGSLHTRGVDLAANYRTGLETFGLDGAGSVAVSFTGTWLDKLETQSLPGGPTVDCAGLYGAICSSLGGSTTPNPKWRHKFRVEWKTPFPMDLALAAQWRYIGGVDLDVTSKQAALNNSSAVYATDAKLGDRSYLDLTATFNVNKDYTFRVGVNNVLDKDPPLVGSSNCPTGSCNGNTYAQMYDTLGRYIFVGVSAGF
ncbi:TonB-dependent receptor domain-containing protein [Phenylobacterium aquaticum]|uniref:TonB-dependent receptor domain-containing protein n=1 Tax=Phenylobacterium aquaticum TaxID=1763816 RepID=UPI001F5D8C62|nr:TonB-dependent receptor [Phenylobacterium aquaticum]MCI3131033.1 TonB-dependent receptor [Phenylobacterium aquaticum]